MRIILLLAVIVVVGAAALAPVLMLANLDPMPGDFTLVLDNHQYAVPVFWSLCASAALGLLYWVMKR
jgi:hypothetical protein